MVDDEAAVAVTALRVRRGGHEVLTDLEFDVPRRQVVGLLGPSGSGKSTLIRAIVGVQRPASGAAIVFGLPSGSRALRTRIGYASQDAAVYTDLSVRQNVQYFADIAGAGRAEAERVIERVGLAPQAKRLVGDLSGGQRNRVSLAVALLGSPELLVLDEPTVGLDPVLRAEFWTMFRNLAASGTTLIVSSHVMDEAQRCDRILLLRDGRLIADTTPAGLLEATGTTDADAAFLALVQGGAA